MMTKFQFEEKHYNTTYFKIRRNLMIFKLNAPSNLSSLRVIQAFIAEIGILSGFKPEFKDIFHLIGEEAFLYVLRINTDEEDFDITVQGKIDEDFLIISFLDKGLPFSYERENSEIERASLTIIKMHCKNLMWINHGKEGKELQIVFQRPQKDITQYELVFSKEKEEPSEDISIELFNGKNAYQISQLIYKCYGYTYPNEDLYFPERVEKLNREDKVISMVAIDKMYNKIIGHYGLERYEMEHIAEFGQAVVEPDYRGRKLLYKMRERLEETAKDFKIKGVFSQPVTSHVSSQVVNVKFKAKPCGLSFGLVPREFNFKKMEVKSLPERETCLMYYKPFVFEKRNLYIPQKHKEIIEKIYENMGIETKEGKDIKIFQQSILDAKYIAPWGFGIIDVPKIGFDFKKSLKSTFYQLKLSTQADVFFLNIPMTDCLLDEYIIAIEELGFFFCGVLPYALDGKDIIRFEYLNTMIDVDRIKVYENVAKEIFNYSASMMKEVFN